MKKTKIVYVPLAIDILHSGHLNIINSANIFIKNYFNNTNHASNSLVEFLKL